MEEQGNLYITINGKVSDEPLSPRNYDVREVMDTLQLGLDILFGSQKRNRPQVTYALEEGSIRHVFATIAAVAVIANAELEAAQESGSLVEMEPVRAKAVLALQDYARKLNRVYTLGPSIEGVSLRLDKQSAFKAVVQRHWFETEFYFYGQIEDWGGTSKSNIHLLTFDNKTIKLTSTRDYLSSIEQNMVYKTCSVRAVGLEDTITGEIDYDSLRVVEIKPYNRSFYDRKYLDKLSERTTNNWLGKLDNPEAWLQKLRGYAE